jgi:hypothetical protein
MTERRAVTATKGTNRRNADGILDPMEQTQIAMSICDHAVNEGFAYHVEAIETPAPGASAWLELRIPAGVTVHISTFGIWTNIPFVDVSILENPTIDTPGTNAVAIVNRNRSGTPPGSAIAAFDDPADISAGTPIITRRVGAGGKDNAQLVVGRSKMILGGKDVDSKYTIEFNNADGVEGSVSYWILWREIAEDEEE